MESDNRGQDSLGSSAASNGEPRKAGQTGDSSLSGSGSASRGWSEWAASQPVAEQLTAGSVLRERFVLEEVIGIGGMGIVFKALDRRRDEAVDRQPYVAIKILGDEFRRHPDALVALQREARKTQKVAHPNIASIYDFDRDGGHAYLVMELLIGEPLSETIGRYSGLGLPVNEALDIIGQMGDALHYAHSRGIVHSDFKPANVYLLSAGDVKVLDFGVARAAKSARVDVDAMQTAFDVAKLGAVTHSYGSPEQLLGIVDAEARDDIFSLGVVAYELLAGEHPFARRSSLEANLERTVVRDIPGLTVRQNAAIRRALAFDRQQRTPSVAEFMHDLGAPRNLLSTEGMTRAGGPKRNSAKRHAGQRWTGLFASATGSGAFKGKSRVLAFASLAIVLGVGVGGGYLYQSRLEIAQREAVERANAVALSLAAKRAAEQEQQARVRAEEERLEVERRLEAEQQARAAAEDEAQKAQLKADLERMARRRDQERARAEARARRAQEELSEQAAAEKNQGPKPAGSAAVEAKPRPGTIYRWQDRSGKVNYGAVVPDEYTFTAVPMTPTN